MADSGEHHCHVVIIAEANGILIFNRPPGLNDSFDACAMGDLDAVGEREEGIGGHHTSLKVESEFASFLNGLLQCVNAGGLSHAACQQLPFYGQDYGIRLGVLADFRGKQQCFDLLVRWRPPRNYFKVISSVGLVVGVLLNDSIQDRKSTRLNSSHVKISYAVFCLKKKSI